MGIFRARVQFRLTRIVVLGALSAACASSGLGPPAGGSPQETQRAERPTFFPVESPPAFREAIGKGTRTTTGVPGPRYWQQSAEYVLTARLDPDTKRLEGEARIVYNNNSPDTLKALNINVIQNFHAANAIRTQIAEITGGIDLERVAIAGREIETRPPDAEDEDPGYDMIGTRLRIVPHAPLPPGASVDLAFDYAFTIPHQGASGRMGWSRDNLFFIAYWYPQMAVYDDVIGWHTDQFVGNAEFYADFAQYDVTIEAPAGWLIRGTGELLNPDETLAAPVLERLKAAAASDSIVHVVTAGDFDNQTRAAQGLLAWHFQADSVHDFAFSATRRSLWDETRTPVGDRDGDGTTDYARIEALYRETAPLWREVARYAAHAIQALSVYTATPYPWPHMTAVEGGDIIDGGMEFPMMTMIGDYNTRGDSALYSVTAHELAHMWVPMIVSNNERRYAWMDEGTTSFNENQVEKDFYPGIDHDLPDQKEYIETALSGEEGPIMRWSDYHYPGPAYGVASYQKPATVLVALEGILGEETFRRAYHTFYDRWAWKHPYPRDLFHTFEDISGLDLDWFWWSWYYETWTLDQAIASVTTGDRDTTIVIEDRGRVPMPVHLTITHADGSTEAREVPVDVWLAGRTRTAVTVEGNLPVTRVEIDADRDFPDVDRGNNVWTR